MVGCRSHQTVLLLREDVSGMAAVEQHHQERGWITVRGRHVRRLHNNMRGTVYSLLDGRTEEQQENGKIIVPSAQNGLRMKRTTNV